MRPAPVTTSLPPQVPPLPRRDRERDDPTCEKMDVRRAKLQLFLQRVCAHPILNGSPDVFVFLTEGEASILHPADRAARPRPCVYATCEAAFAPRAITLR